VRTHDSACTAPGPTFDVFLTPESAIVGRVIEAANGAPVEGVTIMATEQGSRVEPAITRSDASGRFRIDRLEPGIYELEARADQLYGEANELVHLGLVELHPAFVVRGRVIVAGSKYDRPCAEGLVRLIDRRDEHSSAAASLREGEIELRGIIPGSYEVAVHCEGAIAEREYRQRGESRGADVDSRRGPGHPWRGRRWRRLAGCGRACAGGDGTKHRGHERAEPR
jgi:hypothetical protein